jgi:hypothetical protein
MYYPKSQVKTNLYAEQGEFVLASDLSPYQGYYWKNSSNQYWTGKTPQDNPTFALIPASQILAPTISTSAVTETLSPYLDNTTEINPLSQEYTTLKSIPTTPKITPYYSPVLPTPQDYQNGEFRRYFCKKINELIYLEINKSQYDLLVIKNSGILWELYFPFNLPWSITGEKQQVGETNFKITQQTSQRLQLPKLGEYLKDDYLKYYK